MDDLQIISFTILYNSNILLILSIFFKQTPPPPFRYHIMQVLCQNKILVNSTSLLSN